MHEIPDERYHVNEEAITEAFFLVLREKELDKITVSDITKKAGIVRSTFYNHYENIPVLITAMEEKTLSDIFHLLEAFSPQTDRELYKAYFLTLCRYTRENPFLASLLRSPRGDAFFERAIATFHCYIVKVTQKSAPDAKSQDIFSYKIACAIGSTIGVLHKWIHEDFRVPIEVIADVLADAFLNGILPT